MFSLVFAVLMGPVDPAPTAVQVTVTQGRTVSAGSGTVVHCDGTHSIILTNRHVCPCDAGKIEIVVNGRKLPATFVGADDKADLAAVKVKEKLPVAPVAAKEPAKGTELRAWGYGDGKRTAKKGEAIGNVQDAKTAEGVSVYFVNVHPVPGDSGCGLFCPKGHLTAVVWGGNREACCVPLPSIKRFLSRFCCK